MTHAIFGSKKATMSLIAAALAAVGVERGWSVEHIAIVLSPIFAYLPAEMFVDRSRASAAAPSVPNTTTPSK